MKVFLVAMTCIGLIGGTVIQIVNRTAPCQVSLAATTMTAGEMTARAAAITGRLMACYGDDHGRQCRPVGLSQGEHPELVIGPVVTCFDGACHLARIPQ